LVLAYLLGHAVHGRPTILNPILPISDRSVKRIQWLSKRDLVIWSSYQRTWVSL